MHENREKSIQLAGVAWLERNWGYLELAGDPEATGDRMDSVGLMEDRIVAIEVKDRVPGGTVWYEGKTGSIEAKLSATLRGLYYDEQSTQIDKVRCRWDAIHPPRLMILASCFSDRAYEELTGMLTCRCKEWNFNADILRWNGSDIDVLFAFNDANPLDPGAWAEISVPFQPGQAVQRRKMTIEDHRQQAAKNGTLDVLDAFISIAKGREFKITSRPRSVAMARELERKAIALLGLFPGLPGAETGLNAGIDISQFSCSEDQLPGLPAPRAGFLNTNRRFRDPDEVDSLFKHYREKI